MNNLELAEEAFNQIISLSKEERAHYLQQKCADHPKVIEEVQKMIEKFEEASFFFDKLKTNWDKNINHVGITIGPYQLLDVLGEGGMGKVYQAKRIDGLYEQKAAIKILKLHAEEHSQEILRERQILANLNHPAIAKIYDAGYTAEKEPYIIMEMTAGQSVDKYCKKNQLKNIDIAALFIQICDAVQHAHQNVVVHRDLKPDNIIVTAQGELKLLDFGISLIHEDISLESGQPVLTPNYCAPEQLEGNTNINSATDIYQLGLLFFNLLTGENAFDLDNTSLAERKEIILSTPPKRLQSAGIHLDMLSEDLDLIIQKALQKNPELRYNTVEAMKSDVEAAISYYPLRHNKSAASSKFKKFIKRNRMKVAAAF